MYTLDEDDEEIEYLRGDTIPFSSVDSLWRDDNTGVRVESAGNIGYCKDGNYVIFNHVNFDTPSQYKITVESSQKVASGTHMGTLLVYVDDVFVGDMTILSTGSWSQYAPYSMFVDIETSLPNASVKFVMNVAEGQSYLSNFKTFKYELVDVSGAEKASDSNVFHDDIMLYPSFVNQDLRISISAMTNVE